MYTLKNIKKLHIELTTRCNASCPVCSRNMSGGRTSHFLENNELTIQDIEQFVPDEIAENITNINYCGNLGDPGMATDLLPILEFFSKKSKQNVQQQVRTNGGMRGPEFWSSVGEFFAKQPLGADRGRFMRGGIVFSVDGLEDTNHIYRRGVKWEKLFANMKAYSETGAMGIWEFLIFDHNKHQVEEAKKLAESMNMLFAVKQPLGFGSEFGIRKPISVYDKNAVFEYRIYPHDWEGDKDDSPMYGQQMNTDHVYINAPELTEFMSERAKKSSIICKSLQRLDSQEVYIGASGHMLPCCFLGGVWSQPNTVYSRYQFNQKVEDLGKDKFDLRKNSMIDILSGPHFGPFFVDSWKADSVENGKMLYCVEMCGEDNPIDKLYSNEIKFVKSK